MIKIFLSRKICIDYDHLRPFIIDNYSGSSNDLAGRPANDKIKKKYLSQDFATFISVNLIAPFEFIQGEQPKIKEELKNYEHIIS
ncbi:hypothetical protein BpHYR1_042064 [Brachionus plicatilis]|uniref:Uncharacterized protein n=1 Tax=Brachionus plicatilis TaxID=10195 RepID=A0A3M7SJ39_BRAPC|nr:hypothetical protein BpHYR1_042064 [Brachionus plicatilis]